MPLIDEGDEAAGFSNAALLLLPCPLFNKSAAVRFNENRLRERFEREERGGDQVPIPENALFRVFSPADPR